MVSNTYNLISPRNKALKEIKFMLRNYNKIKTLIEKRKEELIDRMNLSNAAWLRGINQESNTFEDVIARFDEDWQIKRYEQWQEFLPNLFEVIKNFESSILYKFLQLRYFNHLDKEQIMVALKVNDAQLRLIASYFNCIVYRYAIKENLFKEEVQNSVAM